MISVVTFALLLLNGAFSHLQYGLSQDDIVKWEKQSGLSCERARVISIDSTNPIPNALIVVREAKHIFPNPHITAMRLERGKVVAKLRADQDGYINLARLKPGDYYFELATPEGKVSSIFLGFGSSADKACTVELKVTQDDDGLFLATRRL
jgi:hypothetical protein